MSDMLSTGPKWGGINRLNNCMCVWGSWLITSSIYIEGTGTKLPSEAPMAATTPLVDRALSIQVFNFTSA